MGEVDAPLTAMEIGVQAAQDAQLDGKVTNEKIFVRIKRRNERKGLRMRRYRVLAMQMTEEQGWYRIARFITGRISSIDQLIDLKAYFKAVRNTENEESPLAFDVVDTQAEADAMTDAETAANEPRRKSKVAYDLTSAEVRPGVKPAAEEPRRGPGRPRKPRPAAPEGDEV